MFTTFTAQFTYFSANYAPVMPTHFVSCPLPERGQILSRSRLISALSLVVAIPRGPSLPARSSENVTANRRGDIFSLNRKVSSNARRGVCATFRRIYRRIYTTRCNTHRSLLRIAADTRRLAGVETSAARSVLQRGTIGSAPSLRAKLQNIDLFSPRFARCFMERPLSNIRDSRL